MTREDAIDIIRKLFNVQRLDTLTYEEMDALTMAIKALEQETCEDAINRQELIDGLLKKVKTQRSTIEIVDKLIPMIKDMPSVQPKSKTIINHGTMNITL